MTLSVSMLSHVMLGVIPSGGLHNLMRLNPILSDAHAKYCHVMF